jgi:hypothetical protein
MMGMEFADLVRLQQHSAAAGELDVRRLLDDEVALDPMVFCRSQAPAGVSLLLRHFGIAATRPRSTPRVLPAARPSAPA